MHVWAKSMFEMRMLYMKKQILTHRSISFLSFMSLKCSISVALLWMLFHSFMSFLYSGAQTHKQCWRLQQAEHSGTTSSLAWLAAMDLMHPRGWVALLAARAHCDTWTTWHQPEAPGPFQWGCSPDSPSPSYTHSLIPAAEPRTCPASCRQWPSLNLSRPWCECSLPSREATILPI